MWARGAGMGGQPRGVALKECNINKMKMKTGVRAPALLGPTRRAAAVAPRPAPPSRAAQQAKEASPEMPVRLLDTQAGTWSAIQCTAADEEEELPRPRGGHSVRRRPSRLRCPAPAQAAAGSSRGGSSSSSRQQQRRQRLLLTVLLLTVRL